MGHSSEPNLVGAEQILCNLDLPKQTDAPGKDRPVLFTHLRKIKVRVVGRGKASVRA